MSKLLNELDSLKEKEQNIINGDAIVKQAETLLLNKHEEDMEILHKIGLDHHIRYHKKLNEDENRTKVQEEIYKQKVYTGEQIKLLCNKYDLRLLPASEYNGGIPASLSREIKQFMERQEGINTIRSNSFWILAPTSQFETIKNVPVNEDPILFYLCDSENMSSSHSDGAKEYDRFIQVTNWGNDFTFLRRFKWLTSSYNYRSGSCNNLTRFKFASLFFFIALTLPFLLNRFVQNDFGSWAFQFFVFLIVGCMLAFNLFLKNEELDDLWNSNKV